MKTWHYVLLGIIILGIFWYMYHKSCPPCQQKLAMWRNKIGSRLIEPKP